MPSQFRSRISPWRFKYNTPFIPASAHQRPKQVQSRVPQQMTRACPLPHRQRACGNAHLRMLTIPSSRRFTKRHPDRRIFRAARFASRSWMLTKNAIPEINQSEYELRPSVTKGRMSKSARTHSLDCGAREFTKSLKQNSYSKRLSTLVDCVASLRAEVVS